MIAEALLIQLAISEPNFPSEPTLWDMRIAEKSYLLNEIGCDEKDVQVFYRLSLETGDVNYCAPTVAPEGGRPSRRASRGSG